MSENSTCKTLVRRVLIFVTIIIVAVILEYVVSNYRNIFIDTGNCLTDVNALLTEPDSGEQSIQKLTLKSGETKNHLFGNFSGRMYAIRISLRASDSEIGYFTKPIKLTIKGYDTRRPDTLSSIAVEYITPGSGKAHENIIWLDTEFANSKAVTLSFTDVTGDADVVDITVNPTNLGFRFNFLRFVAIVLIGGLFELIFAFKLNTEKLDFEKTSHVVAVAATCVLCIIITSFFCSIISNPSVIKYPFEHGVNEYDPYAQQTDAFLKCQLHIDYPVSDELLSLENPYDYDARKGIYYLWDRAMYDGKYYSYFGIAPILNFYLPFKLLTGNLPNVSTVKAFYLMIASLFICAFLVMYVKIYKKKIPVSLFCVGLVSLIFSSDIFLISRGHTPFYYLASIAGTAYLAAFLFFTLTAINSHKKKFRIVFFLLAGFSYSMLFLSRLNMALLAAFIVLPIIWFGIIKSKSNSDLQDDGIYRINVKRVVLDLISLGGFVAATLIFSLWFNYARFGSPFEFGTNYQLTISDVSKNTIDLSLIPAAIYHYFLQPLGISSKFPFFFLQYSNLMNYGRYVYVDTGMGLFTIPLMAGLLLSIGYVFNRKKPEFTRWLCGLSILGIFVITVMNFCLGGVIFRYTADVTLIGAIISTLLIFDFNESVTNSGCAVGVRVSSVLLMLFSIFVTFSVALSINGNLEMYDIRVFTVISEFFKI